MKIDRRSEIEREVFEAVDRMCLRIGALLHEAQQLDRRGFTKWVETSLPFGIDKARRLIAIHLAYSELPPETVAQLPRPWQALYALRSVPVQAAIDAGEIGPETTVVAARTLARRYSSNTPKGSGGKAHFRTADTRAGDLMQHSPDDLSPAVRDSLRRWLEN